MPEDHQCLVREATAGIENAVGVLIERHLPFLLAYVRVHAGPELRARDSTLDLVQSACREVLEDLRGVTHLTEAAFRHWLCRAASRKFTDRLRYHRRARRDVGREARDHEVLSDAEIRHLGQSYGALSPSRQAIAREGIVRIEKALGSLPPHYREVIVLGRILDLPCRELATRLDRTEAAVRQLLQRALARFAAVLGPEPL